MVALLGALAFAGPVVGQTVAAEQRLIDRLVEEDLGEFAIDYLERAAADPLIPDEFKRVAPYRIAKLRVNEALRRRDAASRRAALDEAIALLAKLPKPSEVGGAEGRALTDAVGRLALAEADEARRQSLTALSGIPGITVKRARRELRGAKKRLRTAVERYEAELEALRGVSSGTPDGDRRGDLRLRLAQARLLAARLDNELASTYASGSDEAEKLNRAAAERLGELYQKYSKWVVGLYAHLYEGRCYRQLGEHALAAGCFESLVTQPATTPELSRLVTLANAELVALRLATNDVAVAVEDGEAWLDTLEGSQREGAEAATLRYWVGIAKQRLAAGDGLNDSARKRLLRSARELLGEAARTPSEVQAPARDAWADATALLGIESADPRTFDEAFQAGKDAVEAFSAAEVGRAAADQDDTSVRAEFESQRVDSLTAAATAFEAALELADRKSPDEQVNEARYLLAYLDYTAGRDARAIKLAAGVALRAPDDPSAEAAARLGIAALDRRRRQPLDKAESERVAMNLNRLAEFTAERWPAGDAAAIALSVLLAQALDNEDLAAATRIAANAPPDQRPELKLRLAAARWERHARDPEATAADRTAMIDQLLGALDRATQSGAAVPLRATVAVYATEALLEAGRPLEAAPLLEAAEHGVATVVRAKTPPADTKAFLLAALRTYVRAAAWSGGNIDRVEEALDTIGEVCNDSGSPDEFRDVLLATAVKQQADLAAATAPADAQRTAVAALAETLERLRTPLAGAEWNRALWRCQALLKLSDEAGAERRQELTMAASDAFGELARRIEREPGFAPSASAGLAVKLQLGECERRLGDYGGAFEAFASLLVERPALLEVQRSAARTLQDWGQADGDAERLEQAIVGARPGDDRKNRVWGWAKLAAVAGQAATRDPKRRELFFEAWLNVAECRYAAANLRSGAERTTQLRKAANTVRAMQRQYPDLGGPDRKQQFEELGAKIDQTLKRSAA
ncbi:MAG: hypothetical protein AAFV43_08835 [Planctomycetota bacterium]